ncbi:MAG: methylenetetrahydrofolate reductase [Eubacteriales bacterium]|nr:methylenetetrahydrofolate reductase [Bacillota bacterium]MBV1728246.1 methylenetetrahydrofolate reductase [Desulforudis sp.]MDQ7788900.1 methylenetetrahydrofolate reductase [Clostridia bacterium]MDZ4042281.1 methylenetetrahydrofolate reductase [Eubacteriales bacterium]MBU4533547.1 methylenetetrahydrofolate reductase [Bacillota bacterium]
MSGRSKLQQVLENGGFAVTCEIGPPKGAAVDALREKVRFVRDYVHAANVTDCQTAVVRLSSIAAAVHLQGEGVEAVAQMTCRDRNRIAMQSDLLGAYSLGIRNLLCLTGDHQRFGNHPQARNVFDLDSVQLVDMVRAMQDEGVFQCGEPIRAGVPQFFLGAVENPFADPFEYRVLRLEKKINAGARFIQTQSVFDLERFRRFMELVRAKNLHRRCYILPGVSPVRSVRAVEYMRDRVPGITIPDQIVQRMRSAADPAQEGVEIGLELIAGLREIEGVAGIHIMAIAWEQVIPELVERAGLMRSGYPHIHKK